MSEERSAASTLFPNLPSAAAPVADRALPDPSRSAAESVYGTRPTGGIDIARAVQDSGVAKPATEANGSSGLPSNEKGETKTNVVTSPLDTSKLTLPEGATLDPALMGDFQKISGVTQANAQSFVDLHQRALTETSTRYWDGQEAEWRKSTNGDPEIGGEKLASEVVPAVKELLANRDLIDPEVVNLLNTYRLGSHPAIIRSLYRIARAL
jgi:hypothetical protein